MKTITGSFRSSDDAQAAANALVDAGVEEADISIQTSEDGNATIVRTTIDEGQLDAAASILGKDGSAEIGEPVNLTQTNIAGHPDGPRPVIKPAPPKS